VVAIPAAAPVATLRRLMSETKHSRVPVYGKDLDDIQGVVEVQDLLDYQGDPDSPVSGLVRPVHVVPETKRIPELLREMQNRRITFAVRRVQKHRKNRNNKKHRRGARRRDQGRVRLRG
jgi:CBS domain containing-hemolysin-like protein